jgi:hypothetical protein
MPSVANSAKHFNPSPYESPVAASRVDVLDSPNRETLSGDYADYADRVIAEPCGRLITLPAGNETGTGTARQRGAAVPVPSSRLSREGTEAAVQSRYYLPQAWSEFIDSMIHGDAWYFDFSFRNFPHPERAAKGFDRFIHRLNRDAFGVKYWKDPHKGVTWARATEKQQRDCDHFHGFIWNIPSYIERMKYFEDWRREEGLCKIRIYDKALGASYYMAKHTYAWKDGQIDLSANLKYQQDGTLVKASGIEQSNIDEYRFLKPVRLITSCEL